MTSIDDVEDPVEAAGILAARVARAQTFGEGNKRTALLLARWILDRNGKDGAVFIPADDEGLADLLVRAARGGDVESELVALLRSRG